ncbi:hypothetical protein GJ496_003144 [Pomphorhynchus laevis]|nr:hypothetical protein GJ496_003144 [Pomphorhynchus laevis]
MDKETKPCIGGPANGICVNAYGTFGPDEQLKPVCIKRRYPLKPNDVLVDIAYCGICHSDIHCAQDEWKSTIFPVVPGHEITGYVKEVGLSVTKFKVGDKCGVGTFVHSCRNCKLCKDNQEQYCEEGFILTYNSKDVENKPDDCVTYGGYSNQIVVNEDYVLKWPDTLSMIEGSPLLCAGITVYSPMKFHNVTKGTRVGVVGLGGLGHIAVRLAHAMGAFVCVLSRAKSDDKRQLAKELGADLFISTGGNPDDIKCDVPLDIIIDTVSANHDIGPLLDLLRIDGNYVLVGVPPDHLKVSSLQLCLKRLNVTGSAVGGIKETQEMLDFCAKNNIVCMTETIKMSDVNAAYKRVVNADVKFRFVIDIKSSSF